MNDDAIFVLRSAQRRRLAGRLVAAAYGATHFAVILGYWSFGSVGDSVSGADVTILLGCFAVVAVVPSSLAWRRHRVRVVITPTEVILHNTFGIEAVPFKEIAGFEVDHRGDLPRPTTLLRLTPGRHRIPRSVPVPAISPGFPGSYWMVIGIVLWLGTAGYFFPAAPLGTATGWLIIGALFVLSSRPSRQARRMAEMTDVITQMNAELDRRWTPASSTAERLQAAHPAFRSIPYDD